MRFARRFVAVIAIFLQVAVAQQAAQEKHVKDIVASQTPEAVESSPFCEATKASKQPYFKEIKIDPGTFEPDLAGLMRKSDEVVLAGYWMHNDSALSPSGHDAITYVDVMVLRSWKGSHKVGDVITFGLPNGHIRCARDPDNIGSTLIDHDNWLPMNFGQGMVVLFLRRDDAGLVDGYRLTGGKGTQGIFAIPVPWPRGVSSILSSPLGDCFHTRVDTAACTMDYPLPLDLRSTNYRSDFLPECQDPAIQAEHAKGCAALIQTADYRVVVRDAVLKKYDGMPVSLFLKDVRYAANLANAAQEPGNSKEQ